MEGGLHGRSQIERGERPSKLVLCFHAKRRWEVTKAKVVLSRRCRLKIIPCHNAGSYILIPVFACSDLLAGTPSILQRLFMGRTKGLKGDGAGMDIRVFPPKARDNRFERSMGDALRQQNEKLEMQEVRGGTQDKTGMYGTNLLW